MSPLENLQKKLPAQFILTLPRIWPTCSAASTLRRPLKQKNKSSPRLASSHQDIPVRFCLLDIERGPIYFLLPISAPFVAFGDLVSQKFGGLEAMLGPLRKSDWVTK